MTLAQLRTMTDEELKVLSTKRNKKNLLTRDAEMAMKVRRERSGHIQWDGISRKAPTFEQQEAMYQGYSDGY